MLSPYEDERKDQPAVLHETGEPLAHEITSRHVRQQGHPFKLSSPNSDARGPATRLRCLEACKAFAKQFGMAKDKIGRVYIM